MILFEVNVAGILLMGSTHIVAKSGVVQGSPASPSIAQCVLVSLEIQNQSIFAAEGGLWEDYVRRRFRATVCRWVDDVHGWIQVFWRTPSERERAHGIVCFAVPYGRVLDLLLGVCIEK